MPNVKLGLGSNCLASQEARLHLNPILEKFGAFGSEAVENCVFLRASAALRSAYTENHHVDAGLCYRLGWLLLEKSHATPHRHGPATPDLGVLYLAQKSRRCDRKGSACQNVVEQRSWCTARQPSFFHHHVRTNSQPRQDLCESPPSELRMTHRYDVAVLEIVHRANLT